MVSRVRLNGVSLPYGADFGRDLRRAVVQILRVEDRFIHDVQIVRRSIDARQRPVQVLFNVDVAVAEGLAIDSRFATPAEPVLELVVRPGKEALPGPVVIVGAGPAGLFAGLLLAEHGYRPTILDRGGNVAERVAALRAFAKSREPDPECNALFGLGGAGTFSDGKLTTGVTHPWLRAVLEILVGCGAPPQIRIDAKPHVGTDFLRAVVTALVNRIELSDAVVKTGVRVDNLLFSNGKLAGLQTAKGRYEAGVVVLAIGHSARDTWTSLASAGVALEPKPFQLGIRVEHPQSWVDEVRYGKAAGHPALGAADYKLATRVQGVPVFSFCMCPGGQTIPTVNETSRLAINGMSNSARDSLFASSGVVVTLNPEQYGGVDLHSCIDFQRRIERECFLAGGERYGAPAQRLTDFCAGLGSTGPLPACSYGLGCEKARLDQILPAQVSVPLRRGIVQFNENIRGYLHSTAVALAPESRASSPIRLVRDPQSLESISHQALYPAGEGAGYAGGIMSAALDGLNVAKAIIERYAPSAAV